MNSDARYTREESIRMAERVVGFQPARRKTGSSARHRVTRYFAKRSLQSALAVVFTFAATFQVVTPAVANPKKTKQRSSDLPSHVIRADDGKLIPAPGYKWVAPEAKNSFEVRWTPGTPHPRHPHVEAGRTPRTWRPAFGYAWVRPNEKGNKAVVWKAGLKHPFASHVLTSPVEGKFVAEPGFRWASDHPGDLTVVEAGPVEDQENALRRSELQNECAAERQEIQRLEARIRDLNDKIALARLTLTAAEQAYYRTESGSFGEFTAELAYHAAKEALTELTSTLSTADFQLQSARNRYNGKAAALARLSAENDSQSERESARRTVQRLEEEVRILNNKIAAAKLALIAARQVDEGAASGSNKDVAAQLSYTAAERILADLKAELARVQSDLQAARARSNRL